MARWIVGRLRIGHANAWAWLEHGWPSGIHCLQGKHTFAVGPTPWSRCNAKKVCAVCRLWKWRCKWEMRWNCSPFVILYTTIRCVTFDFDHNCNYRLDYHTPAKNKECVSRILVRSRTNAKLGAKHETTRNTDTQPQPTPQKLVLDRKYAITRIALENAMRIFFLLCSPNV